MRRRGRRATPETGDGAARSRARVVVNATGPFCDGVRRLADPRRAPLVAPSQGVHLVLDRSFLPGDARHHGAAHPRRPRAVRHPLARPHAGRDHRHADRRRRRSSRAPLDAGDRVHPRDGRPLPRTSRRRARTSSASSPASARWCAAATASNTAALSRDHTIHIDASGLLTITGGKWTTYRNMAEDCVDQAADARAACRAALRHPHAARPRLPPARRSSSAARRLRLRRRRRSRTSSEPTPALGEPLHPAAALLRRRGGLGGARTRWRARSRTCWPAAPARCS